MPNNELVKVAKVDSLDVEHVFLSLLKLGAGGERVVKLTPASITSTAEQRHVDVGLTVSSRHITSEHLQLVDDHCHTPYTTTRIHTLIDQQ